MALVHLEDAVERLESARPGAERCWGRRGEATPELVDAKSQPVNRPVRASAAEMRSSSASEAQSGFSQRPEAPASIAAMLMSACSAGGAAMSTRAGRSARSIAA